MCEDGRARWRLCKGCCLEYFQNLMINEHDSISSLVIRELNREWKSIAAAVEHKIPRIVVWFICWTIREEYVGPGSHSNVS